MYLPSTQVSKDSFILSLQNKQPKVLNTITFVADMESITMIHKLSEDIIHKLSFREWHNQVTVGISFCTKLDIPEICPPAQALPYSSCW